MTATIHVLPSRYALQTGWELAQKHDMQVDTVTGIATPQTHKRRWLTVAPKVRVLKPDTPANRARAAMRAAFDPDGGNAA